MLSFCCSTTREIFSTSCFRGTCLIADPWPFISCLFWFAFFLRPVYMAGLRNTFLCHKTRMPSSGECSIYGLIASPRLHHSSPIAPAQTASGLFSYIISPAFCVLCAYIRPHFCVPLGFAPKWPNLEALSLTPDIYPIPTFGRNTRNKPLNWKCPEPRMSFIFSFYVLFRIWHVHYFRKKSSSYVFPVFLISTLSCVFCYGVSTSPSKKIVTALWVMLCFFWFSSAERELAIRRACNSGLFVFLVSFCFLNSCRLVAEEASSSVTWYVVLDRDELFMSQRFD